MTALFLNGDVARPLQRSALTSTDGRDEKWLQALLFRHPELIPIDQIDPGAGQVIPICRELSIPKEGSAVFLDMLGVTAQGRLVLVECKLWRNPQARREVIAQILEYAALLRQWTYADLTGKLKQGQRWTGPNPLFERVLEQLPALNEVQFVERVSRSLLIGDFDLIVAGDGIRSDLQAIAGHLNGHGGMVARLALVEFQLWIGDDGQTLIVPALPLRTQIVEHRVVMDSQGIPLPMITAEAAEIDATVESIVNPEQTAIRLGERAFWQQFIDGVHFDHPDQIAPRLGGRNWVRIGLPGPTFGISVYRARGDKMGLLLTLMEEDGATVFTDFEAEADQLRGETGLDLAFTVKSQRPFRGVITATRPATAPGPTNDLEMLVWLKDAANRMVNAFRPRLTIEQRRHHQSTD